MKTPDLDGTRIHFMGIGGIGMSALAELAHARGAQVDGCDREESENTARLRKLGIGVQIGHDASHAETCDRFVFTPATPPDHPERGAAGARGLKRGAFLAELMQGTRAVGISGTHGKTTTTWIAASLLIECGMDPTVVLGGIAPRLGGNLRIGGSGWVVTELDESDESFLLPTVEVAVITNIESDHMHHYGSYDHLRSAFRRFAHGVACGGVLIANQDNPECVRLLSDHPGDRCGFGTAPQADLRCTSVVRREGMQEFSLDYRGEDLGSFRLQLAGGHNIENAMAAIAVALHADASVEQIRSALPSCESVDRRMQRLGCLGSTAIYSDYAHHPTEVRAAIRGVRSLHPGRVWVVFQPHLYSRTRDYVEEFGAALAEADTVTLAPIYPAREEPIAGVSSRGVADAVEAAGGACSGVTPLERLAEQITAESGAHEAIVLMGAGDIDRIGHELAGRISSSD